MIDLLAGSNNYVICNNNVYDNGYEGMVCSESTGGGIIENIKAEHNEETEIKLFPHTNSTMVSRNDLRQNERFGIYLRSSSGNSVISNFVAESQEGITLAGSSVRNNVTRILSPNDMAIELDDTSQSNAFRKNRIANTTSPGQDRLDMPNCAVVYHTFPRTEFKTAAIVFAGHWHRVVEPSVAIGANCFESWKVAIEELLARPLFFEPEHLEVQLFGMCQDSIIGLVVSWRVKLAYKNRPAMMLLRIWIPESY